MGNVSQGARVILHVLLVDQRPRSPHAFIIGRAALNLSLENVFAFSEHMYEGEGSTPFYLSIVEKPWESV